MTDFHQDGRAGIDAHLVRRLLAQQFPQWADLPVTPVKIDGWDNRTYRLGSGLTARLPTHSSYVAAVDKEHQWLPVLGPQLPVEIPEAVAKGAPGEGYPYSWAIRRWIPGETASVETVADLDEFARSIASFILALQSIDATGGPAAGAHSFHRGAPPEYYHDETLAALAVLKGRIDTDLAREVWDAALATSWDRPPVWFHGDIANGNLLVQDGHLSAVIDFGTSGVGDPACDLVIAYTFFSGSSRATFRDAVDQDPATWARARGWALWKALITEDFRVIDNVLTDYRTQSS
ncbi:aminoglycoside phosphotransferase (APT) family kinase protein [Kribbella sp. VKM Ac-2571]|uniref:aminoglycoside phosphotransferase family protein n=1 Tax=Kribbella sp. VKM Ac-2571 TaxID=2512222 RepID=UPI00105EFC56|nr:aminoglycoside phosphotransferase family protein [Kribbella sp. VKM Ac-2571]TDO69041.1 aminoglycoside phosphotransferase (APT) family kinase protein [Kribbella sp. VKM Ac-2571]